MKELMRGRLLVATPPLVDPNFDRSVVLLLDHGTEGAIGLVLNRPGTSDIGDALPQWRLLAADPPVIFSGGPVAPDAAIALARGRSGIESDGWAPVVGRLGTIDLSRSPEDLPEPPEVVRVFAGYSGWGPGQLEGEIEQGGWFVVDSAFDDPFTADPNGLWRRVLARQHDRRAWFANCPTDVSTN